MYKRSFARSVSMNKQALIAKIAEDTGSSKAGAAAAVALLTRR
jgi:nucleoid DNA-binding protein